MVMFLLSVTYDECHMQAFYAECRYAECRNAECRDALIKLDWLMACTTYFAVSVSRVGACCKNIAS
jgi:hypothetical protein